MDYVYSLHIVVLQYSNVLCVSLPYEHYMFNLDVFPMSINSISILSTWMFRISFHRHFLIEVNMVEANQRTKLFYPSFILSMDENATIILSSFCEMTKTSKIRLPP